MKTSNDLEIILATSFWQRVRGLLWQAPLPYNRGLCLMPCKAIHTFGMAYSLDIIFLDSNLKLCKYIHNMPPNRFAYCCHAFMAIELPAGFCRKYLDFLPLVQRSVRFALQGKGSL